MTSDEKQGCLTAILRLFGRAPASQIDFPYRLRDNFLSPAELSFYHVLNSAVEGQAVVFSKVRLLDVMFVPRTSDSITHQNRIQSKHLDFVLCKPDTMKLIFGIELDDSSHQREDRKTRDEFVDLACKAANFPLLRIPVQRVYDVQRLKAQLQPYLDGSGNPMPTISADVPMRVVNPNNVAPLCPKCGVPMVVRTVSKGANQGKHFYGCRNYPDCRQMLPMPE